MTNRLKIKILLLTLFLTIWSKTKPQEPVSLDLLPSVSQSSLLNPAVQNNDEKLVIGVPFFSGLSFSWNAGFPLDAFFSQGLWNYSFHDFYNRLAVTGNLQASAQASMFYASLKRGEFTFSVSVADRAFGTAEFDREIIRLIRDGVEPYWGEDDNFGAGTANFTHFREISFGISHRYWKEFDIGIRPKLLFGRTYFDARDVNFSVEAVTDASNNELLHLNPEGSFTVAAPLEYTRDSVYNFVLFSNDASPADYSFNLRNLSVALDLGVVYRPNQFYEFSASILDLGISGFKHNTYRAEFVDPIEYPEYELFQSNDPNGDNFVESREAIRAFADSVSYIIDVTDAQTRVVEMLPIKINLSGKYNFSESLSFGFADWFAYYGMNSLNLFSGFAQKRFNRVELAGDVSLYNFSDILLGMAASYTADHVQFYAATKNILGFIQPANAKHLNLSFGVNFLFNTRNE